MPTPVTFSAGSNRVATINGVAIVIDAAGQMASDGTNQLTWDDAGRLKTVSRGGTLYATYYYDHRQRRTRKVTTAAAPQGARTIVYHYDEADRLIAETGVPLRSYLWADDTLLAQVEYQFNATSGLYTVLRELIFELDHLGTPRQARLTDGTVVWRWESDGYGNTAPNQDPDGNGQATYVYLRFPGQYYDEESGLHYNGHRYYAPRLGRYLSSDPIGINGGSNTYGYVNGNPLSYTDPTGEFAQIIAGGVIGGLAGLVGALNDPCATGLSITKAVAVGAAVGAASAAVPVGGALAGAVIKNALAGFGGNSAGQVVTGGVGNYSPSQAVAQGVVGGLSGGYGNAFGLTTGLNMVGNGATAASAISTSFGVGTTGAIGMGVGLNMLLRSGLGGLNPAGSNSNGCTCKQ